MRLKFVRARLYIHAGSVYLCENSAAMESLCVRFAFVWLCILQGL